MSSTSVVPRGADRIAWQVACGLLLALAVSVVAVLIYGYAYSGSDVQVYHQGGASILDGVNPYDFTQDFNQKFIYTPFAAIAFVPLSPLPLSLAMGAWTLIAMLCLAGVLWRIIGRLGVASRGRQATWTLVGMVAVLPLTPVVFELWVGQIEIILMAVVFASLTTRSPRWRGYGVGIAAGIKLTPLIFIPYLLLTRQFRTAGQAVIGFLGTILVGFAVIPGASWSYWKGMFVDMSRMLPDNNQFLNQSIRGLLERLPTEATHGTGPWLLVAGLVGAAGLAVATWAHRRGEEITGILACAITGVLCSPLSWGHHWVWCVPVVVLCFHRAWRNGSPRQQLGAVAVWLAFASGTIWIFNPNLDYQSFWSIVFTNQLIVIGLALLATLAVLLWRGDRRARTPAPSAEPAPAELVTTSS
jgi:alpha-1,2-mannosyltransferase